MEITVIQEKMECERLWRKFSPQITLFDLWEFRVEFSKAFNYPLHFIAVLENDEPVGLLPLWYVPEAKTYFWWGDTGDECHWQEENNVWARDEAVLSQLIEHCPRPCLLNNLTSHAAERLRSHGQVERANDKQVLDLSGFQTSEDYISSLPKKARSNVRGVMRKIEALHPRIILNHRSHFNDLVTFNKKRYPNTPLNVPRLFQTFEHLFEQGQNPNSPYASQLLAVCVGDDVAGVDLIFTFNKTYTPFLCGNQVDEFPGIGHFSNIKDIEDALTNGFTKIDFLESDPGSYKEKFFTSIPQFQCLLSAL